MQMGRALYTVGISLLTWHVALFFPMAAMAQQPAQQGVVRQTTPIVQQVGEGNQYYLGQANELLIRVNVWGRVLRPGEYFVPATTDLLTLISVAGGPVAKARLGDIQVVRASTANQEGEVIVVNLRKYLKTGDKRLIPALKPEDTVIIHGSVWQLVADVAQVIGAVALVGSVYYYFWVVKK
jgi:hypothetical protein